MLILIAFSLLFSTAFAVKDTLSLPKSLYATKYALTVNVFLPPVGAQIPDEDVFEQDASVMIDFVVKESTRFIVLNADGIKIKKNFLWNGRTHYHNLPVREVKSVQKLYFEVPYTLAVGETLQFHIEYTYKLRSVKDEPFGLYRSTWVDENNVTHHIAATQFETIHARKVVPCLDDPTFRSVWALTVNGPKGYKVDANTQKYQTTNNGQTHRFSETPSIPSYLLAFAAHDQAYIQKVSPGGFKYGFIGPQEKLRNCQKLIAFTGQLIDTLVNKFKVVKIPFEKMDFIQVGRSYTGGMENPGLITLGPEQFCNYDNGKQASEGVITHEMLHQWFGNIVTQNGWENIIMAEGLTTYYEKRLLRDRYPNSTLMTIPGVGMALTKSAIYKQPTTIEEAVIVDQAKYYKTASLFHMLETMVGIDNFDAIVNTYLKKNENKWGSIYDFLHIAENTLNKPNNYFTTLFMPYFTRTDYPVVVVTKVRNGFTLTTVLAKNDTDFKDLSFDGKEQEYYVPVWYGFSNNHQRQFKMLKVGTKTRIGSNAQIMYVNPFGNSYHRTCYIDSDMWLPIAYYAQKDLRWKGVTWNDFKVCTRYDPIPNADEVLKQLELKKNF